MQKPKFKIPTGETICLTVKNKAGETFVVTQNKANRKFIIYATDNDKLKKLGTDVSPRLLEERFVWK